MYLTSDNKVKEKNVDFLELTCNVFIFYYSLTKFVCIPKESIFLKLTSLAEKRSQIFICKQLPLGVSITIAKLCLQF